MAKTYEFTGLITGKLAYKIYKKNEFYGNTNYKLFVLTEESRLDTSQPRLILFVYANLVNKEILQTIQKSQYINKRYLLICQQERKRLILTNWQEITSKLTTYA